jgi:CubicO group peptidase (beta-lactamase class C family)
MTATEPSAFDLSPIDAEELGFDRKRLERVVDAIDADIASERCDGVALSVARHGHVALRAERGFADRASKRRLTPDDAFVSMSIGKQMTVAIVLQRIERGELRLSMPVAELIPEFACRGKQRVTLFHLLTHTSGIASGLPPLPPEAIVSIEQVTAWAATSMPESSPGERVTYSVAVAHAVMAEMVRRAEGSKRSFARILEEELFRPLGMKDTCLGGREDLVARLCPVVARYTEAGMFLPFELEGAAMLLTVPGSEFPAGGFLTTLDDVTRFAEMFRRGGELDGHRVLSPAMLELATLNHTGDLPNSLLGYACELRGWQPFPAYLGLGFFLRGERLTPGPFGTMCSPGTFGGLGAGSTCFWIDPERDLTFSFLSTGLMEDSRHIERVARLSDIVLAALVD